MNKDMVHGFEDTREQWEKDFDDEFDVEEYTSEDDMRSDFLVKNDDADDIKEFIRRNREQVREEERERILIEVKILNQEMYERFNFADYPICETVFVKPDIHYEPLKRRVIRIINLLTKEL